MNIISGFESWSELDLLAGCIYGEASGEPYQGKVGVGLTIQTRTRYPGWWGRNWREVILCPKQFSCWDDHNRDRITKARKLNDVDWRECYHVARDIYLGVTMDTVGGPTHYHALYVQPAWSNKLIFLAQIGQHRFYRDGSIDK